MATIREFELYRSIASDRLSDLHLGRDSRGEVVAIRMYGSRPGAEPALVEAILAAARKVQSIDHPGVVRVLAVSDVSPHFVATALPRGESLRTVLDEAGPLPPLLAARIASEIAAILDHVHELRDANKRPLGLVHGALCPENVCLTWDGAVQIADVGAPGRTVDARAGGGAPTVSRYMAPEQAIGARVDRRADVFSLGAMLWEMLTGERLFDAPTPGDLVTKITIDEIPAARAKNPDVPERLSAITGAALVRSLVRRTASAGAARRELETFLGEVGAGTDHATYVRELMRAGFAGHRARREDQIAHLPPPGRGGQVIAEATTQPTIQLPESRRVAEASIIVDPDLLEDIPTPLPPQPLPIVPPPPAPVAAPAPAAVAVPAPVAPPMVDLPDSASFGRPRFGFLLLVLLFVAGAAAVGYALFQWEKESADMAAPTSQSTGGILVRSDPEGAHVEIDGRDTGKRTPARIDGLTLDAEHDVRVFLDGYQAWTTKTTALPDDRMLHAMLLPAGLARPADAGVAPPSEAPAAAPPPGPRPPSPASGPGRPAPVARPGERGGSLDADPEHSEAAAAEMGFLSVQSNARAMVYLDGRPLGRAPLHKARVPSGTHRVRVQFDGVEEVSRDARVQIRPGWEFNLRVDRE
jgi:serine/threonine-protein kinase